MTGRSAVQIVADGEFGAAVAEHLGRLLASGGVRGNITRHPPDHGLEDLLSRGSFAVLATWRDVHTALERFSVAATAVERPWLPIAMGPAKVRVGPLFVPGSGPCLACLRKRTCQHSELEPDLADHIDRARDEDPTLGVTGHPPHVAAMAAGLALTLLRVGGPDPVAADGALLDIDYTTDLVYRRLLIPVHGCAGCHPADDREAATKVRAEGLRTLAGGR